MIRFLFKLVLCVLLGLAAGFAYLAGRSGDPVYGFYEWTRENKIDNFRVEQLFDPKTNLEAGAWYLRRALERWKAQSDPMPFALAEYNAGASRAQRWSGGDTVDTIPVQKFLQSIDFPATRKYVESIIARYEFYQRRGRM